MNEALDIDIAKSLEVNEELLPHVPELLADLWALGSSPNLVVDLLKPLGLPPTKTRVLDLGCGKGAVSVKLAQELGFKVSGIDAFRPFLEEAKKKAIKHKVAHLCEFRFADMREYVKDPSEFDVVVYASIGNVLGSFRDCVSSLRRTIRPGGYMIIDDGYLKSGSKLDRRGYEHYISHGQTLRQLTSHGDIILQQINTETETKAINDEYLKSITGRVGWLKKQHPELEESLDWYIENQSVECEIIDNKICGTIWLVQKAKWSETV